MVDHDEGLVRLCHSQSFLTEIERRQVGILEVQIFHLLFEALEEKRVIPIRDFQMRMEPFRHL